MNATNQPLNPAPPLDQVLDLARWAPSGDNTQPWRFETLGPQRVVLHGHDTRHHCVYDLDGWATQLSMGALVETAAIAATAQGWRTQVLRRTEAPEERPTFELRFETDPQVRPDPLLQAIPRRAVQRRPFETTPLSADQKAQLEASVASGYELRWLEPAAQRRRMATLLFHSARLRLVTPEAYRVHSEVIEWGRQHSIDKVPDQSLGVPQAMLMLMKFAMHSWPRVQFFNRFMGGTLLPRVLMDYRPSVACAAHFLVLARKAPGSMDEVVEGGRAMQRFWLTAEHLGLCLQPEMTPLIFARYAAEQRAFSRTPGSMEDARRVAAGLGELMGSDAVARGVFIGRIGRGPAVQARSLRLELAKLRGTQAP